jgi:hypothetical protein
MAQTSRLAFSLPRTVTRVTDRAEVSKFSEILGAAFAEGAFNRYMYLGRESRPDHPKLSDIQARTELWQAVLIKRFDTGAIFVQACNYSAVAVW